MKVISFRNLKHPSYKITPSISWTLPNCKMLRCCLQHSENNTYGAKHVGWNTSLNIWGLFQEARVVIKELKGKMIYIENWWVYSTSLLIWYTVCEDAYRLLQYIIRCSSMSALLPRCCWRSTKISGQGRLQGKKWQIAASWQRMCYLPGT